MGIMADINTNTSTEEGVMEATARTEIQTTASMAAYEKGETIAIKEGNTVGGIVIQNIIPPMRQILHSQGSTKRTANLC